MSQQIQEFISSQQQQLEEIGHRLNREEHKLSAFGQNVVGVRKAHQTDVECLEERQSSTEGRPEALKSGIQVVVSEKCGQVAKELQASQNKQMKDFRQEMLREIARA